MAASNSYSARLWSGIAVSLLLGVVGTVNPMRPPAASAQSCDDLDVCTVEDSCQADGSCRGTPLPNGSPCDDGNSCTLNESCLAGRCTGTSFAPDGTACTSPLGGLCVSNARCLSGFCFGDFVECPDDGNACTDEFCNPQTGQCTSFTRICEDACSTGQCDPTSGDCINVQPINEGAACDDGNDCTANDRCQSGECRGGAGQVSTPTPTPTPTPPSGCAGDCNGDDQVTIDELITGVKIALGNASLQDCQALDLNDDGNVRIDEIIRAVNAALTGCLPTVQTATPTMGTPSTGVSVPQRAAATIDTSTVALLAVPDFLSVILSHAGSFGAGSGAGLSIPIPFTCPAGGSGTVSCSQSIQGFPPTLGPPSYVIALNSCMVAGSAGATLAFNGSLTAVGQQGDFCGQVPSQVTLAIPSLTIDAAGVAGATSATFNDVSGSVAFSGSDPDCTYNTVSLDLTGTIGVESKDANGAVLASTELTFGSDSSLVISIQQYGSECVPQIYTTTVQGGLAFSSGGTTVDATFTDYVLQNDASSGVNQVTVSGQIASACLGTTVQLSTGANIQIVPGMPCPQGGEVLIMYDGGGDLVRYTNNGGVEIDTGNDGGVDAQFNSCLDPALFQCPAG